MNTGLKIFLFAIGAVLLVLFIALGISTASAGKVITEMGTSQVKEAAEEKVSLLKAKYDGNSVIGSELVSLIEETIEDKAVLAIAVRTLDGSRTDYNYTYDAVNRSISVTSGTATTISESKSSYSYINRNSLYACKVETNLNDNIICLWFEQEK